MSFSKTEVLAVAEYVAGRFDEPVGDCMPTITDFFVFGSTVKEEVRRVHDLDLCAFYINDLSKDAMTLPDYLCVIEEEMWERTNLARVPIDFIVLPPCVLWDEAMKRYYGRVFKSPQFVENILEHILRWNKEKQVSEWTSGSQLSMDDRD